MTAFPSFRSFGHLHCAASSTVRGTQCASKGGWQCSCSASSSLKMFEVISVLFSRENHDHDHRIAENTDVLGICADFCSPETYGI